MRFREEIRDSIRTPKKRIIKTLFITTFIFFLGLSLGWAGKVLLAAPKQLDSGNEYAIVTAESGSLGRSINLNVKASWQTGQEILNQSSGVLTSKDVENGQSVSVGDLVYTADLIPVFAAQGDVPAFREMTIGVEGKDVAQLQRFLNSVIGFGLSDKGIFGPETEYAVKVWQSRIGIEQTGIIPLGQLLFLPQLPASFVWNEEAKTGSLLEQGKPIAKLLVGEPNFSMVLPKGQLQMVSEGMRVEIKLADNVWAAQIGQVTKDPETGDAIAALKPIGDETICAKSCSIIPIEGNEAIPATIFVVPEKSGIIIPNKAIRVTQSSKTVVLDEGGSEYQVAVLATVAGRSVVEGIEENTKIRVFGNE